MRGQADSGFIAMPCLSHSLLSVIKCLFGTWCDVKQGHTEETDRLLQTGNKTLLIWVKKLVLFYIKIYFLCDLFRIEFMCSNTGFIFVFALSSQVFALGYILAKCSCLAWSSAYSLLTSCVTAEFFLFREMFLSGETTLMKPGLPVSVDCPKNIEHYSVRDHALLS